MKPPAFQFYADDFLAGTSDMTAEEVGAYIRLLCQQWSKGGLPNDDRRLSIMAGVCVGNAVASVRHKFGIGDDGLLRNARLEREREKQHEYREKQSENAKKRWNNAKPNALAMPTHIPTDMPNVCFPSPSPSPSLSPQEIKVDRAPRNMEKPTLEALKLAFAKAGGTDADAEKFLGHYEANGWRVGKNPMRSWPHAVGNWMATKKTGIYENPQRIPAHNHRNDFIAGANDPGRPTAADILRRRAERVAAGTHDAQGNLIIRKPVATEVAQVCGSSPIGI